MASGRRLVWFRTQALQGNFNIKDFDQFLKSKYALTYQHVIMPYARKYQSILINGNLSELNSLPQSIRNNVIKSLTILAKFLGRYSEWKHKLDEYGIKLSGVSSYNAFLRIFNNHNNTDNNVSKWINDARPILNNNENLLLKFLMSTGLRKEEAITSFNMIIELNRQGKLKDYYDESLECLMHFRFPKAFCRRTKNAFISFVRKELVNEISHSQMVSYPAIRKRLNKNSMNVRLSELRDFYATLLLENGFNELEVNLLQGRINGILFKHYYSPKLADLRDRVFKTMENLAI